MWSDNETSTDCLGFQHLTTAITSIVRDGNLLPTTIGVFGDWGSGKSSLLQMAGAELAKDEGTLVLAFNGWLFEGLRRR
jgi:predicted KAP-like P-loop ATPase